jgi:hypothetical protein
MPIQRAKPIAADLPVIPSDKLSLGTSDLPTGTVLQVVTVDDNTRTRFSSRTANTWYDDYNDLDISITPKSSNSKLIFFVDLKYGHLTGGYSVFWQIREGTTVMPELNGGTSNSYPCFDQSRGEAFNSAVQYHLFSAIIAGGEVANTATTTRSFNFRYRLQGGGTIAINHEGYSGSQGSHSPSGQSRASIIEIAG